MPLLFASLLGGLINIVGSLVGRAVLALGLSVVTYTGMSTTLNWLKSEAIANFHLLPPAIEGLLAYMKVGVCISIVFSAILVRLLVSGLSSDTVKRWVTK
ncbi:MAG: DUF2523 domain-containing protein [Polynucleobacter sp.]|nr:DUF2523 domain-containing protein [Polynucleobacter sp.]